MLAGVGVSSFPVSFIKLSSQNYLANHFLFLAGFYINLPIGAALAILLLLFKIPEPTTKLPPRQVLSTAVKSLDLPGFMLISPAAVMFLLALQYGGTVHPWNSSVVIGLLVGAAVTFILFLIWEYHQGDGAMVPFAMIRKRIVWSAAGTLFFCLGAILVAEYYLVIYFQTVLDNRPIMSGVHLLPATLGLVIFTMLAGMMSPLLSFPFCKFFKITNFFQPRSLGITYPGAWEEVPWPPLAMASCL